MKSKVVMGLTGAVCLMGAGAGAFAVAQDGSPGEQRTVTERVEVGTVVARDKGPVVRAAGGPTIGTYFAQAPTVPPEGMGAVVSIKCPRGAGNAIGGGARTSEGIVVSYLSKGSPGGQTSKPKYYVGVDDNSSTNPAGSGAFVEVQCAKQINVR